MFLFIIDVTCLYYFDMFPKLMFLYTCSVPGFEIVKVYKINKLIEVSNLWQCRTTKGYNTMVFFIHS